MKSLALRLTLLGVFIAAAGTAAYFSWASRAHARLDRDTAASFDQAAVRAERDVLELRAAQTGYVAAGQGEQFWASKVDATVTRLRDTLNSLRTQASAAQSQAAIDTASSALQDFEQLDRRARGHAATNQRLLASDLIFTDGVELSAAAATAVEEARLAERQARVDARVPLERRELAAAGAALAVGLIALGLLVPRSGDPAAVPQVADGIGDRAADRPADRLIPRLDRSAPGAGTSTGIDEGWSAAKVMPRTRPGANAGTAARPAARAGQTGGSARTAPPAVATPVAQAQATHLPPTQTLNLAGVASLCTDLARVVDTQALPALLERAAAVLDANGIVLWIADPDGRELSPILAHGYPPQLVARLGTIARDAENATASAFRTALLQTVRADAVSNGAIAAPLVTPAGCVGVMAAEVRRTGESDPATLAVASIVAAQLATLVGPPSSRAHAVGGHSSLG